MHSTSCLDRIYVQRHLIHTLLHWKITDTIVLSDHKMVLTRLSPPNLPFISKGRWTMPLALLSDKNLLDKITKVGMELQQNLAPTTPHDQSLQQKWLTFKQQITTMIKESAKKQTAKMMNKANTLRKDMHDIEQ